MTTSKNNLLSVDNLSVSYGKHRVLEDINFKLYENEIIAILGPSGVGKTTLFQSIAGFIEIDSGKIFYKGKELKNQNNGISYMLQKDLLFEHKTVFANAALPLIIQNVDKLEIENKVLPLLKRFGLENTENLYPYQLSGGMRQRLAFLRTFLSGNDLTLLDEPFSALDTITRSRMQSWYHDLAKQMKLSSILVTHDIDEAILLADKVFILNGQPGKIVKEFMIEKEDKSLESFSTSSKFMLYKKEILKYL